MNKKAFVFTGLIALGGLVGGNVFAATDPVTTEMTKAQAGEAAAKMVTDLRAQGLTAEAAMAQAGAKYPDSVQEIIAAASEGLTDDQVTRLIKVAIAIFGPDAEADILAGLTLAGLDPTQFAEAAAAGRGNANAPGLGANPGRSNLPAQLPGITNRGSGGGGASPS